MTLAATDALSTISVTRQATLEKLNLFYRHLGNEQLSQLAEIYHPQAVLIDPVGRHEGIDTLKRYFEQLLTQTRYCRFDIEHQWVNNDEVMLFWRMIYSHPRLKKGKELTLDGNSHLKLSADRVIYQRDYYDLGAMLYEHIPLLGSVIKALKSRLAP